MQQSIVVAIDSYKGSASSQELNQAVKEGIHSVFPKAKVSTFEIADGGEGTLSVIKNSLGGQIISVETVDLLNRPIIANYLLLNQTAIIEVAEVVGIAKITPNEETFQTASTIGLANLFIDAKTRGVKEILVSLGGSGTSDGGLGLLKGLGARVTDLSTFDDLDLSTMIDLKEIRIIGMADVTNPYAGRQGFSLFFGQQKGGSLASLDSQNKKAHQVVQVLKDKYDIDLQSIPGTGSAGGLGGALVCLGGSIASGFSRIAELLQIEEAISKSDLIITGEGKMDFQTANGKVPFGMASMAAKHNVDSIAICGAIGEELGEMENLLLAAFSIQQSPISLKEAMEKKRTLKHVKRLGKMVTKLYFKK